MKAINLTIRVEDYNIVAERPDFLSKLRALTLYNTSGMNHELDSFEKIRQERPVNVQILTAFRDELMVGWALLSREQSDFPFNVEDGYNPIDGSLFEVYVDPSHRQQGIATELFKAAKRQVNGQRLCVCPHDEPSIKFYQNFLDCNNKHL